MYATDDLRNEHEGIKIAISVLLAMTDSSTTVDINEKERLIDFLKTFVDKCHHGKEELLLFPALISAGLPAEGGPVSVMLMEHEEGRKHIRSMSDALRLMSGNQSAGEQTFANAAKLYAELLINHIEKENNVLFTMAERLFDDAENKRLAEGFEDIERERIGPGVHERYHAMLDEFAAKYLSR